MDLCFSYLFTTYKLEPMIALVLFYQILKTFKNARKEVMLMASSTHHAKTERERRGKTQSGFLIWLVTRETEILVS